MFLIIDKQSNLCYCVRVTCSSVVRVFAHGAMGCWIDPSWGGPIELTKAMVCAILSVGWCI